jgi:hypothetical protein
MPPWRRVLNVLEVALYGSVVVAAGLFADDSGYIGTDPLARREELPRRVAL